LLWIVGDARRFNEHGAVPTNITRCDSTRSRGLIRRPFFRSDTRLGLNRGDQWVAGW
jgi:hypothetical protein